MKKTVFISGLHRSGTSILHRIVSTSGEVTGFENTGAIEDEGQLLQTVFEPASTYGGPGKFAFDPQARLNEKSTLINDANRQKLNEEWGKYWDPTKTIRVEKSPPNLIRTRFFQGMYPDAYFIPIIRHPVAVSYATQKWSKTSLDDLIRHWIAAYEIYQEDRGRLERELTFSYEEMTHNDAEIIRQVESFLGITIAYHNQLTDKNSRYFERWKKNEWWQFVKKNNYKRIVEKYETAVNQFGYSLVDLEKYPSMIPQIA